MLNEAGRSETEPFIEAQFRVFAETMPNQVWTAPASGELDWFNAQIYAYSGLGYDDLFGQGWTRIVHPDDLARAGEAWADSLRTGERYEVEFRIRRADGDYRWHIVRALPIRDGAKTAFRWIGTNTDIHDRKVAEAENTRERERMWALSREMMLVCDFVGLIVTVNPSATRILGWKEDEMIGRLASDFVHPEDVEGTTAQLQRLAHGEATLAFENRYRTKSGGYRLLAWTAVPEGGRVHAVGRDITDERRTTQDRDRIWTLSPVVKVVARTDGKILAVNPSWTRVLGWSSEETVGRNVLAFVAPEDRQVGVDGMAQLAAGVTVIDYQNTFATRSGGRRRFAWTTVPEDGILYGFGRDITAEVEAAGALAASVAERARIWRSTNDLMGTAGADGFLKAVNPAWSRLLGYEESELLSQPFVAIIDPDDHARVTQAVGRLSRGEAVHDLEDRLIHKDGGRSLIAWSAEPAGDVFYIVGRDITEQRAAEDALRQSQKMEAVGQLTGGIAHDFNNLLQGITGSLDLVQKRITQGRLTELDRFITSAMTSANRASALTHRLLAFSRRQPLDPKALRANPLLASMEELLRRTLGERIELELVLAGGLWLTLCDPNQLENAVLNLVINARDAMPDGGKLTIETCNAHLDTAYAARQRDVRPGQYVCICVTDTGTGMDADTIARAFEPFFTTKPLGQGTGLGLSMIYGFARQSEGYAKIYSEIDKGTTFKLYLPRHRGEAEEDDTVNELTAAQVADVGEIVLVVEDEAVVRGLILEVLNDLGYQAVEAADGPSGLEILRSGLRIDLVITDIGLPGLNGRQMVDAARQLRPGLKVLFMTGYAENAARASGFLEPGMTMITKPFAMETLAKRVRDIIESEI